MYTSWNAEGQFLAGVKSHLGGKRARCRFVDFRHLSGFLICVFSPDFHVLACFPVYVPDFRNPREKISRRPPEVHKFGSGRF